MKGVVVVVAIAAFCACDPQPPASEVLRVQGDLTGPEGSVDVAFDDPRARGEWWPCDARLTSQACVDDDFHVGVFLGLPTHDDISDLGGNACVVEGEAQGAFEILRLKFDAGDTPLIPDDVSAFVLIASDVDGDGSADLDSAAETHAAARISVGSIDIGTLFGFEETFSLRLTGTTEEDEDVVVEFRGEMTNPALVPGLEAPATCVGP